MKLKAKVFESSTKSWKDMCEEVSDFASPLGQERIVNMSVSSASVLGMVLFRPCE
jgi:hypothetical protein